jgi:catechol 2,3-dioxygenase-like lactoylglutathione lyase family enzyme
MSREIRRGVSAESPDSPISLSGTDHITVEGTNIDETIEFYRDLLGLPLVLSQPNLDRPELTHLFFDTGDGRLLTFFVDESQNSADLSDPEPGQVHHLAFRIDAEEVGEIATALREAGYPVSEYDRGAFHSLYTEDNNGLTLELVADKFVVPDDRRGEVLARAHKHRLEDGAEYVGSEHMHNAIEELGLPIEEREIRDAPAGRKK